MRLNFLEQLWNRSSNQLDGSFQFGCILLTYIIKYLRIESMRARAWPCTQRPLSALKTHRFSCVASSSFVLEI